MSYCTVLYLGLAELSFEVNCHIFVDHSVYVYICEWLLLLFLQSRSHLLRHTSYNRYKPFDVFREQRERRRTICNKKLQSQTNCTPAIRQEHCLSTQVQPCDDISKSVVQPLIAGTVNGCEPLYCCTAVIPSSHPSSDFVVDTVSSYQMILGYNTCKNTGAHTLEEKLNFTETVDKHSESRTKFTTDTLKEPTIDGESATYDRYDVSLMSLSSQCM